MDVGLIELLDPKKTHESNPECQSRLAQSPNGYWFCIDCHVQIMVKRARITLEEEHENWAG